MEMNGITITVSGARQTGKSTVIEAIKKSLLENDIVGVTINEVTLPKSHRGILVKAMPIGVPSELTGNTYTEEAALNAVIEFNRHAIVRAEPIHGTVVPADGAFPSFDDFSKVRAEDTAFEVTHACIKDDEAGNKFIYANCVPCGPKADVFMEEYAKTSHSFSARVVGKMSVGKVFDICKIITFDLLLERGIDGSRKVWGPSSVTPTAKKISWSGRGWCYQHREFSALDYEIRHRGLARMEAHDKTAEVTQQRSITHYTTVSGDSECELMGKVHALLAVGIGWRPQGGVSVFSLSNGCHKYIQAMVR